MEPEYKIDFRNGEFKLIVTGVTFVVIDLTIEQAERIANEDGIMSNRAKFELERLLEVGQLKNTAHVAGAFD